MFSDGGPPPYPRPGGLLMRVREAVGPLLSQRARTRIGDAFVSIAPRTIQRAGEQLLDFPITHYVRSNPILLIRVPRTGSVSTSMQIYGRVRSIPHRRATFYLRSDPDFFDRAIKIAVVRNPWDRLLSAYGFLRANGTMLAKPDPQSMRFMHGIASLEHLVFDHLVPNAARLHLLDPTLHHQHDYVCDRHGTIIVDRIFHTEDLDAMSTFLASLGLSKPLPHLNASIDGPHRATKLTPRIIDAVAAVYARDIALFGYSYSGP